MCGEWEGQDTEQWGELPFTAGSGVPKHQGVHHDTVYFPVKMNLLHCAPQLARTSECAFQKTDLEELLYCSRIKVNENYMTLVKPIFYLLPLPCLNPITPSSPHFGDTMLWGIQLSLLEISSMDYTCRRFENPQNLWGLWSFCCVFAGEMESIYFQKSYSLLSGYGIRSSTGWKMTLCISLPLSCVR